jgi:hypothetical protein
MKDKGLKAKAHIEISWKGSLNKKDNQKMILMWIYKLEA